MRIAIISTTAVAVPPRAYGGTELITAELAKMLTRRGHDVTVYATGDSTPDANLRFRFPTPVWPPDATAELRHAAFAWGDIKAQPPGQKFDVVHAHQMPSLAFATMQDLPTVLTIHHVRDEVLLDYYLDFPDIAYIGISSRQAELLPELAITRVIHHGLDPDEYNPGLGDGGYAAFLGRLAPEKGAHTAIDAARLANVKLRVGGAAHWVNAGYFDAEIQPRLDASLEEVEWLGELSHAPKVELLRGAVATLFPIEWEEPFGLVMVESMLVGTPVITFARGSTAEIVDDGVTGFVVRDRFEMATRLRQVGSLDRGACRRRAVERWSSMRMAREYEEVYREVAQNREARSVPNGRTFLAHARHTPRPSPGLESASPKTLAVPEVESSSGLFSPLWKARLKDV